MVFICQCMYSCQSTLKHAAVYMLVGGKGGAGRLSFCGSLRLKHRKGTGKVAFK